MLTTYFSPQQTSSFSRQNLQQLKEIWQTIDAHSCPHHYNFHMHTVCSDGQLTPEDVIQQAIKIGLQGLAITDHHTVQGYHIARDYLQSYEDNAPSLPQLWTGVEITSLLMETDVHILGYGFDPNHPSIVPYGQVEEPVGGLAQAEKVIAGIHQAGGLAVLAHPERYRRPAKALIPKAVELGIDGVETYYAYKNLIPWQPTPEQTAQVKALSDQYGLFNTCGTDTHGVSLLRRV